MQEKRDLLVLTTGGTLDAAPYEATPQMVQFAGESKVGDALLRLRDAGKLPEVLGKVEILPVCRKDSKDVDEADIARMVECIARSEKRQVVVTYGTDRMPQIARRLKAALAQAGIEDRSVAVTGAMEPLAHGKDSDGWNNLADAVEVALHSAKPGVRIVMHGMVLNPDRAVKDFARKAIIER